MVTTLAIGVLVTFVATTAVVAWRTAPTRARCPRCGQATAAVKPPLWFSRAAPGFKLRWCAACSWQGMGREGPELTPGRPVAHDSGFRWGSDRFPPDFGFRFAESLPGGAHAGEETPSPAPDHPSGFRFAGTRTAAFQWGRRPGSSDFAWRAPERRRDEAAPFHWKG